MLVALLLTFSCEGYFVCTGKNRRNSHSRFYKFLCHITHLLVSNFYVNCALVIAVTLLFALLLGEFRTTAKGQIDLRQWDAVPLTPATFEKVDETFCPLRGFVSFAIIPNSAFRIPH